VARLDADATPAAQAQLLRSARCCAAPGRRPSAGCRCRAALSRTREDRPRVGLAPAAGPRARWSRAQCSTSQVAAAGATVEPALGVSWHLSVGFSLVAALVAAQAGPAWGRSAQARAAQGWSARRGAAARRERPERPGCGQPLALPPPLPTRGSLAAPWGRRTSPHHPLVDARPQLAEILDSHVPMRALPPQRRHQRSPGRQSPPLIALVRRPARCLGVAVHRSRRQMLERCERLPHAQQ
jgi:hypothetical protein